MIGCKSHYGGPCSPTRSTGYPDLVRPYAFRLGLGTGIMGGMKEFALWTIAKVDQEWVTRAEHPSLGQIKAYHRTKVCDFSWSTTCWSVFVVPRESFSRNHSFRPRNARFSTPLLIALSTGKNCNKNAPPMFSSRSPLADP